MFIRVTCAVMMNKAFRVKNILVNVPILLCASLEIKQRNKAKKLASQAILEEKKEVMLERLINQNKMLIQY